MPQTPRREKLDHKVARKTFGQLIHTHPQVHSLATAGVFLPTIDILKEGLNVLAFKVVSESDDWQGAIRFTDAWGEAVKGIRATLDPEE